jgi:predicted dienelactone hydrolase
MTTVETTERAALKAEAAHRRAEKAARNTRIRAFFAANPGISIADTARAFNVHDSVVRVALGRDRRKNPL